MALIKSQLITQASGSIGGLTFSRAAGGLYIRARAIPTNPNTTLQSIARNAFSDLVAAWTETLTTAQREAWDLYASNVAQANPLGTPFFQSGQNAFVQCNTTRLIGAHPSFTPLTGLPLATPVGDYIATGPQVYDRGGDVGSLSLTNADAALNQLTIAYDDTKPWANEDDAALVFWMSKPRNPSRKFFRGPWRLLAAVLGDSETPPTSPLTATVAAPSFDLPADVTVRVKAAIIRADGRYSLPTESNDVVST